MNEPVPQLNPFEAMRIKKVEAQAEREKAALILKAEHEHLRKLFVTPEWAALVRALKARQSIYSVALYNSNDHLQMIDARAEVRALQAVIDLPLAIPK